jgi:branched-chain amino acid transport system substrate-binding protein
MSLRTGVLRFAAILTSLALVSAACGAAAPAPSASSGAKLGKVKIGIIAGIAGTFAPNGVPYWNGINLARENLRDKGVIDYEFDLIDTNSDPAEQTAAYRTFASRGIKIVLSSDASTATIAATPVAQANNILVIAEATADGVTAAGNWIWQGPIQTQPVLGAGLMSSAKTLGYTKAAIMMDNNAYGQGTLKYLQAGATANGVTIVGQQTVDPAGTDFTVQLNAVKAMNPDVILAAMGVPGIALLIKQARTATGLTVPIMGPNGLVNPSSTLTAGASLAGTYAVCDFVPMYDDSLAGKFTAAFKEKYNLVPGALSAAGYDQLHLLTAAIEMAGGAGDNAKVRDALAKISIDGVTGTKLRFDGTSRSIIKTAKLGIFDSGKNDWILAPKQPTS